MKRGDFVNWRTIKALVLHVWDDAGIQIHIDGNDHLAIVQADELTPWVDYSDPAFTPSVAQLAKQRVIRDAPARLVPHD